MTSSTSRRRLGGLAILVVVVLTGAACGIEQPAAAACLDAVPQDCTPLFEPTFDNVYGRVLEPKCALAGGACHANEGAQGGLALGGGADAGHASLTGTSAWLRLDDPSYGAVLGRVLTSDADRVMPPGAHLPEG